MYTLYISLIFDFRFSIYELFFYEKMFRLFSTILLQIFKQIISKMENINLPENEGIIQNALLPLLDGEIPAVPALGENGPTRKSIGHLILRQEQLQFLAPNIQDVASFVKAFIRSDHKTINILHTR